MAIFCEIYGDLAGHRLTPWSLEIRYRPTSKSDKFDKLNGASVNKIATTAPTEKETVKNSVSVIIAAYNAEETIAEAIRSAIDQTRPPHEIIVVNDGSSDNTAQIIRSFVPSVVFLEQKNGGPSSARNLAARHATGDWLACLDADDVWMPTKLERQLALDPPEDVAVIHCLCNNSPEEIANELQFSDIWHRNWITHSTTLIRREVFAAIGGYDETLRMAEDYNLWLRISYAGHKILTTQEQLAHYQKGSGISSDSIALYKWERLSFEIFARINGIDNDTLLNRISAMNSYYGISAIHHRNINAARTLFAEKLKSEPNIKNLTWFIISFMPIIFFDLKRSVRKFLVKNNMIK